MAVDRIPELRQLSIYLCRGTIRYLEHMFGHNLQEWRAQFARVAACVVATTDQGV